MADDKYKLKNRRKRLDEEIDGEVVKRMLSKKKKEPPPRKSYEEDFAELTEIDDLKLQKKELLKGISGKSEAEKKKIEKKLRELNDKIMALEE